MRQHFAQFHAALAVAGKLELWRHDVGIGPDKGIPLAADDGWWQGFAIVFCQGWFVIEKFEVRWSTCHEEMNHRLGFPAAMGRLWQKGIGGDGPLRQQTGQAYFS
jgi:hypothetical protein